MISFRTYKIINVIFHVAYIITFNFILDYTYRQSEWFYSMIIVYEILIMKESFYRSKRAKIGFFVALGVILLIYVIGYTLSASYFTSFPWYYRLFWFVSTFTLLLLPVKAGTTAKETEMPVERGTELIQFHPGLLRLNLLLTGLLLVALGAMSHFFRERILLLLPVGAGLLFQLGVLVLLHRLQQRALTKRQLFQFVGLLEGVVGVLFLIGFFLIAMRSTSDYYRPSLLELRSLDLILSFVLFILLVPGPGAGMLIYMLSRSQKSSISPS